MIDLTNMITSRRLIAVCMCIGILLPAASNARSLSMNDLQYVGAFRVTSTDNTIGRTGFSETRFAVSPSTNSFFFVGNPYSTIAEFQIPTLSSSTNIANLSFTGAPIQNFTDWKHGITNETAENDIRNAGPISLIDGKLVVTVYDTYDASAIKDVDTMLIIEDPYDMANSAVTGYFGMQNNMLATGWRSPIPSDLQAALGGDYLTGSARMASISGRWSMGPSAYSFDKADLLAAVPAEIVVNTRLQYYPLEQRMSKHVPGAGSDISWNYSGGHYFTDPNCPSWLTDDVPPQAANENWKQECVLNNDLWTEPSFAHYGVIVPGTETYLTVGTIAGVRYGNAYKIFPINGGPQPASGEYPHDNTDWDNYIWLFDTQDLIDHKNGLTESYDATPYEYGAIKLPFDDLNEDGVISKVTAADYDAVNNRLYLVLSQADRLASFEATPIVLVYEIIPEGVQYTVPSTSWTIVHSGRDVLCSSRTQQSNPCALDVNGVYSQITLTTPIRRSWVACISNGCTNFPRKSLAMAHLQ